MRKVIVLVFGLIISISSYSQDFNNKPWENELFPIIIDPYSLNKLNFEEIVKDSRVSAIIHKASQGFKKDDMYLERSKISKSKKILYASYHLGTKGDPIKQADFYLKTIENNLNEPFALDIEDIGGNNISLEDAIIFINRIYEKTNKYPFIYVNNKVFNEINSKYDKNSVFAKCPLWYARFITKLPNLNNKIWDKVTIWQFSCEINCSKTGTCLYNIPGTSYDLDINVFNGNRNKLNELWK